MFKIAIKSFVLGAIVGFTLSFICMVIGVVLFKSTGVA